MTNSLLINKRITLLNCLVFFSAIIYFIIRICFSSGQLSPDGINYLLQAQNLWNYKVNFPLGYAFLIKLFSFFTGSYFTASKLINILVYVGIIAFSYRKNFFFTQTLFIFSFYPFLDFFTQSLSESVYYFIIYLIIYYTYRITKHDFKIKFAVYLFLLFFILTSLRFSGLFIFFSSIIYFFYLLCKKELSPKYFILLSFAMTLGVSLYLLINYLYCGFALGQRDHLHIEPANIFTFITNISLSTARDFSFLNGILHQGIFQKILFLNIWVGIALLIAAIVTLYKKRNKRDFFTNYLILSFIIIFAGVFYSYYTTKIDNTIRIKSMPYLYLVLLLLTNLSEKIMSYLKILALLFIFINIYTILKYSDTILNNYATFDSLICPPKAKSINLIYNEKIAEERNHAAILMFKAIAIDRNYKINENTKDSTKNKAPCSINSNEIIK